MTLLNIWVKMRNCDNCHRKLPTQSAVINGKFGEYCNDCISGVQRSHNPRSAQYARDRDWEAHEADMLQPWDANGKPSREFIRNYPEEAHVNFTQEELEKYG